MALDGLVSALSRGVRGWPRHREGNVLSDYPVNVVLLATDLDAVKDFYANKVGLKILNDNPGALVFKCGGDSEFTVTRSTVGTKDDQTQAAIRVKDVRAEVTELRRRGVKIEDYHMPTLKTIEGIADIGFAWKAPLIEPSKHCIRM